MQRTSKTVVIIGGGVIGASAACYLKEKSLDVVLLEKGEIGHACSFGNAGYVCPSHFVPLASPGLITQGLKWLVDPVSPFYIKPRVNLDLLAWLLLFRSHSTEKHVRDSMTTLRDLALASLDLYRDLATAKGLRFGLQERGLTMLFDSDKGKGVAAKEIDLAAGLGLEVRLLDQAGLAAMDPAIDFRCRGGIYWPGDSHIDPASFMREIARHVASLGVSVKTSMEVRAFRTERGRITGVETNHGLVEGDEFVLAGGSWSPILARQLGIRLLLQPGKGYSVTVEQPAVKPRLPYILNEARVAITPFEKSLRFGGTMELAGLDLSVTRRRVDAILRAVPRYLGNVDTNGVSREGAWSGLRPVSPDGLPYVGRFRKFPNLIAATGHAMLGVTLATGTGKLVSEIVAGDRPFMPIERMAPDRFSS